jgi:hypothetical protein
MGIWGRPHASGFLAAFGETLQERIASCSQTIRIRVVGRSDFFAAECEVNKFDENVGFCQGRSATHRPEWHACIFSACEARRFFERSDTHSAEGLDNADVFHAPSTRFAPGSSKLGSWSYEVYDCKLACETKAATILQLSLSSELSERLSVRGDSNGSRTLNCVPSGPVLKSIFP